MVENDEANHWAGSIQKGGEEDNTSAATHDTPRTRAHNCGKSKRQGKLDILKQENE
jgi:hypothetical protein